MTPNLLAYTTTGEWHWLEHVIAGSVIRSAIWHFMRGMSPLDVVCLAAIAVGVVLILARREWR